MNSFKYLKDKIYYSELYDRFTIEECRHWGNNDRLEEPSLLKNDNREEQIIKKEFISKVVTPIALYFIKGDRYIKKEEIIARWMDDDKEKDRFYESSESPKDVRCLKCRAVMNLIHKDLWTEFNKSHRVLFMFDCPNGCLPRRAFYDNGEEWMIKPNPCPKCGGKFDSKDKTTKSRFITHYKCASCGFTKIDELERTANKKEEPDPNFEADRAKFCLSKEEGEKWREELISLERIKELVDGWKEKDQNKELYDRVAKIKRLTVIELEKLLVSVLEKDGYVRLQLSNPEIDKIVAVPFIVQDSKSGRESRASEYDLKRLFKKALENTNWRLMSDGVNYRLGILSGRLRGYEGEEDLKKLVITK